MIENPCEMIMGGDLVELLCRDIFDPDSSEFLDILDERSVPYSEDWAHKIQTNGLRGLGHSGKNVSSNMGGDCFIWPCGKMTAGDPDEEYGQCCECPTCLSTRKEYYENYLQNPFSSEIDTSD